MTLIFCRLWTESATTHTFIYQIPGFTTGTAIIGPGPINPSGLPRRPDGSEHVKLTREQHQEACRKLAEHYSFLGFKKWSTAQQDLRNLFPFWGLSLEYDHPLIAAVVPHFFGVPVIRGDDRKTVDSSRVKTRGYTDASPGHRIRRPYQGFLQIVIEPP